MKVAVVTVGKFHHFELARQLQQRGMLQAIFTGFPQWKLRNEQVSREKIQSFPWIQTVYQGLGTYGFRSGLIVRELEHLAHWTLGRYAAKRIEGVDVAIAFASCGAEVARTQKANGRVFICDRPSSHIKYQNSILREEFKIWSIPYIDVDERTIAREMYEYDCADFVTVPSSFSRESFLAQGVPPERVVKIPYGVNLSRFKKIASRSDEYFDILFVGQVSLRKGVPYLLQAFAKFRHPRKRLTVIGSIQPHIRPLLSSLDTSIQILGPMSQPQICEWMSRSHVLVLPSIEEGLAYVQAEAMACGCPVIGTDHSGARDLFEDGREGFIVPIRDPNSIADRLQRLADDPAVQETMSRNALDRVAVLGGWDAYGRQMCELLTRISRQC